MSDSLLAGDIAGAIFALLVIALAYYQGIVRKEFQRGSRRLTGGGAVALAILIMLVAGAALIKICFREIVRFL